MSPVTARFPFELALDFISDDKFRLNEDFVYRSKNLGLISALKQFVTDGASIPKWVRPFIGSPWSDKYPKAAVIHDWLCSTQGLVVGTGEHITKKETDQLFLEMMRYLKVSAWKRYVMYKAVRAHERKYKWEEKETLVAKTKSN